MSTTTTTTPTLWSVSKPLVLLMAALFAYLVIGMFTYRVSHHRFDSARPAFHADEPVLCSIGWPMYWAWRAAHGLTSWADIQPERIER